MRTFADKAARGGVKNQEFLWTSFVNNLLSDITLVLVNQWMLGINVILCKIMSFSVSVTKNRPRPQSHSAIFRPLLNLTHFGLVYRQISLKKFGIWVSPVDLATH